MPPPKVRPLSRRAGAGEIASTLANRHLRGVFGLEIREIVGLLGRPGSLAAIESAYRKEGRLTNP